VAGSGYAPVGSVQPVSVRVDVPGSEQDEALRRLAAVGAACNDASLRPPPGDSAEHAWIATGDPTEASLLALAGKLGVERDALLRQRPRLAEIGFDANRRRMTTVHRHGPGYWAATKGAPEAVLRLVDPADAGIADQAAVIAATWAAGGYRVLALADRELPVAPEALDDPDAIEPGLRLVGVVAMSDPARPEAAAAVAACRSAGITAVMITGDDPRTARAIAGQVGILPEPAPGGTDGAAIITGAELTRLDDPTLRRGVGSVRVYARTEPEQKLRIVDAWQSRGDVVAMTGDGVNDAPALRRADIGVAMGVAGTEVSKDAADMVLADDNFATIVDAVREGRRIYDNLRRFVKYLLTTNSGEIWVMFLASVFALPVPLSPVQILWVNLVTDGAPAVALGLEPAERDVMRRSPRPPSEPIMAGGLLRHALWVGLLMAAVCLVMLVAARAAGWPWQTMVFTTLALLQLGHGLAVRSERESFFTLGLWSNPALLASVVVGFATQLAIVYLAPLQELFGTEPLDLVQLAVVLLASCTAFIAVEVEKLLRRRAAGRAPVS
jgi:Ca2+-transporting ATPase